MREGWHKTTIGTLISSGAIQVHKDGNHGANYPRVDDFGTDGLPFLTAKSISGWTIDFQGAPRLSRDKAKTFKFGFVKGGDVLLSHNATVGRVAIVPEGEETAVIGTSLTQFRVDRSKILPEFLALYFSSREFQEQLSFVMAQTTRNQVPITEQRKLPIQLPELDAQQAIVDVAFRLIDKIELNRKMNATLEAMARALFRDWFVDFGPTRARMKGRPPYLSADLWPLFPDRLDAEGKPEGWEVFRLEQIAEHHKRTLSPSDHPERMFEHFSLPAFDKGQSPALDLGDTIKSNKTLVPPDAVLLSKLNPEILRVWLPESSSGNQQIASTEFLAFTAKQGVSRNLLFCLFSDDQFREMLQSMVTGTSKSHQRISPPDLLRREVLAGSADVIEAFEALVSPLLEQVLANRAQSRTLAQTRDLLLPRLMSGELRVTDAERIAGEVA